MFRWYEGRGEHLLASCVHDWLYQYHYVACYWPDTGWRYCRVTKRYADRQWYRILHHVYVVRETKEFAVWYAVHVGGWWAWYFDPCALDCDACQLYQRTPERYCPVHGLRKIDETTTLE